MKQIFSIIISTIFISFSFSQSKIEIINKIVSEANNNSQLENLAHELIHAKQFISGESSPDKNMESEAYGWEERLYEKYFRKLNV